MQESKMVDWRSGYVSFLFFFCKWKQTIFLFNLLFLYVERQNEPIAMKIVEGKENGGKKSEMNY